MTVPAGVIFSGTTTTTSGPPVQQVILLPVRLAPVQPHEALFILLAFIAILRRLGLLPPPEDDEEYTSLEQVRTAAHAYVNATYAPASQQVLHERVDAWYVRATTGEITMSAA